MTLSPDAPESLDIDALETREYLQNVLLTRHVYQRLDDFEARRAAR